MTDWYLRLATFRSIQPGVLVIHAGTIWYFERQHPGRLCFDRNLYQDIFAADHFTSFDRTSLSELDRDLVGTSSASAIWPTARRLRRVQGMKRTNMNLLLKSPVGQACSLTTTNFGGLPSSGRCAANPPYYLCKRSNERLSTRRIE